ncbi:unnamed protein product, partial [Allacma fusca]
KIADKRRQNTQIVILDGDASSCFVRDPIWLSHSLSISLEFFALRIAENVLEAMVLGIHDPVQQHLLLVVFRRDRNRTAVIPQPL